MRKFAWVVAVSLLLSASALADKPGQDMRLACRSDDPFVFCTQGCKDRDKNWIPISPISGTWRPQTGYCPYPQTGTCCIGNVCFIPWTQTAVTAVYQYMQICPRAHNQGTWDGRNGRPESTPFDH